jgi:hypothetical protein
VRTGQLAPGAVAAALPRMRGLDGLYQEFWLRVVQGMPAEREARLWRVAGLLAVARTAVTAEQLCQWAGLEDGEFIVLRAVLQQYLDEVVLPNERDPSAPLVGFRLYHASFRDFLARQPGFVARQHHERIVAASLGEGADAPPGRYLARHGLAHCREAGRPDAALVLAGRVAAGGGWDAITDLVESMHEERAADAALVEGVLGHLKGQPGYGARLACLLYNVWRMPTPIAGVTTAGARHATGDGALARALWVVDLIDRALRFTGILAAADCLSHDPLPEPFGELLRLLGRPTLGQWVEFQRRYYQHCAESRLRPAFPLLQRLLSGRQAKELYDLQVALVAFRNDLAHRPYHIADPHGAGLHNVMGQAERYFEVLAALAEGQLLVFEGPADGGRGRFRVFAGPSPRPGDAVERPVPPGARPGEVFFALAGDEPVSLSPWILAESGADTDVPLLMYDRATPWAYSHLGRDAQVCLRLPGERRHDLVTACRLARESWPPRDRPLTADDFVDDARPR